MKIKEMMMFFLIAIAFVFVGCGGGGGGDDDPFSLGMEMVSITTGNFMMGSSDPLDSGANPPHSVTLTKGFYMGKYEVTQEQYKTVMGTNPSYFDGSTGREVKSGEAQGKRPVEQVSWYDALVFCNKLSKMEELTPVYTIKGTTDPAGWGTVPDISNDTAWDAVTVNWNANGYRLPTEAEWEYACRAGTSSKWHFGDDETKLEEYAWYGWDDTWTIPQNSEDKTHQVGLLKPNSWGLCDMHGNVWEWCWDWYDDYAAGAQNDPTGPSSSPYDCRVFRGGWWGNLARILRSAARNYVDPWDRGGNLGFRVVRR